MTLNKYNEIMENVKVSDEMRKRILDNIEKEALESEKVSEVSTKEKKSGATIINFRQYAKAAAAIALLIAGFGVSSLVLGRFGSKNMESSAPAATESAQEFAMEATDSAELYEESALETEEAATEEAIDSAAEYTNEDELAGAMYDAEPSLSPERTDDSKNGMKSESTGAVETEGEAATEQAADATWEVKEYASAEELSKESHIEISDIESLKDVATEITYRYYYTLGIVEIQYQTSDNQFTYRKSPTRYDYFLTGNYEFYETKETEVINNVSCTIEGYGSSYQQATWSTDEGNYSLFSENGMSLTEFEDILKDAL